MLFTAFFQRLVKVLKKFALVLRQLHGCFYRDVAVQIAGEA